MHLVSFPNFCLSFFAFFRSRLLRNPLTAHKSPLDLAPSICVCVALCLFAQHTASFCFNAPNILVARRPHRPLLPQHPLFIFCFYCDFRMGLTRLTPGNCFWLTTDNVSDIFPSRVNAIRICGDRTHCHDTARSTFFMFIGQRALSTLLSLLYMRISFSLSSRNISPAIMHLQLQRMRFFTAFY